MIKDITCCNNVSCTGNIFDHTADVITTSNIFDHTVDVITTGNIFDYTTDVITTGNIFDHTVDVITTGNIFEDITCCNNIPEAVNKLALSAHLGHSCETE
jgi:hypothetical protein